MSTTIDPIAVDVGSDNSESVKSDSSQLSYIDDYENLPSNGPRSHAHIVDLGEYADVVKDKDMVKLQDAIVTTLYNVSVDMLESFLSPTVNTFKATFGKKDVQMIIWRKGLEVFVGTYAHHSSLKIFQFEHVAGFLIGYDGSWHLKVTAGGACSNNKWPDVWAGKFDSYAGIATMSVEGDEEGMAKRAWLLADLMLSKKYWELKSDIKMT